jgi:hypothetical protein
LTPAVHCDKDLLRVGNHGTQVVLFDPSSHEPLVGVALAGSSLRPPTGRAAIAAPCGIAPIPDQEIAGLLAYLRRI